MSIENELDNLREIFESIVIDDEKKGGSAKRIEELEIRIKKNEEESVRRKEKRRLFQKGIEHIRGHKFYTPLFFGSLVIGGLSVFGYWCNFSGEKKTIKTTINQLSKSIISPQNADEMLSEFLIGYAELLNIPEGSFPEKRMQISQYQEWYYTTLRDALEKSYRLDEIRIVYFSRFHSKMLRTVYPKTSVVMTNGLGEIWAETDSSFEIPKILRISPTRDHVVAADSDVLVAYDQNLNFVSPPRKQIYGNFERTSVLWLSDGSGFYLPHFGVLSPSLEKKADGPKPGSLEKRNSPFRLSLEDHHVFLMYGDIRVPIAKPDDQGSVLLADIAP